ncbi:MAG TPA: hypothetical protein VLJ37_09920 [bacterium]|nr:hypothetical protein [bacterium]
MVTAKKKRLMSVLTGFMSAAFIATAAHAYFHDSPAIRNKAVINPADSVTYIFIPTNNVSEFFGKDFNGRDFKEFTVKNFGNSVDKDFTSVPTDAVIMYQLKIIMDKLDAGKD